MKRTPAKLLATAVAVAVTFTLAHTAAARDWQGRGRINGKVLDMDGKPIGGATIKLVFGDSGQGTSVKSKKNGSWGVGGLRGGMWNIDVEAEGYVTSRISYPVQELGAASGRRGKVEVRLEKAKVAVAPEPSAEQQRSEELKTLLSAGDEKFQAGDFAGARAEYEKVLAEMPELTEVERSIAYCLYKEGKLAEAATALTKIVETAPTQENLLLLSNIQIENGDLDVGMATLERVDQSVVDPGTFLNIGILLLNRSEPDKAAGFFEKVITSDPAQAEPYYFRGLSFIQSGKNPEAKADFEKYLELAPEGEQATAAKEVLRAM